jgi:hypothetical protein
MACDAGLVGIKAFDRSALEALVGELDEPRFRAGQSTGSTAGAPLPSPR